MAGVTMSIHKLTAGSGYDYLTRQVAAFDATEKGHVPLASYYTERGESPGVWIGSGLAGIDGLKTGDPVTAEQMRALFGVGLHPLAEQRQQQLQGPDLTDRDYQAVTRLGAPFKIYRNDIPPFRVVHAEAQRLIRAADLPTTEANRLVDLLVDKVLTGLVSDSLVSAPDKHQRVMYQEYPQVIRQRGSHRHDNATWRRSHD
jgi:hypothetical protein